MKKKAIEILEEFADAYSEADIERLERFLDDIRYETAMDILETIRCCRFALKDCFDIAFEGMVGKIAEDYGLETEDRLKECCR